MFKVWVRRVVCAACGASLREPLAFCPGSHVGYTKWLAKYVLALRRHLCISAVAELTGLLWDTVKAIEKRYLARKYHRVCLKSARLLGIDEVYLGARSATSPWCASSKAAQCSSWARAKAERPWSP